MKFSRKVFPLLITASILTASFQIHAAETYTYTLSKNDQAAGASLLLEVWASRAKSNQNILRFLGITMSGPFINYFTCSCSNAWNNKKVDFPDEEVVQHLIEQLIILGGLKIMQLTLELWGTEDTGDIATFKSLSRISTTLKFLTPERLNMFSSTLIKHLKETFK